MTGPSLGQFHGHLHEIEQLPGQHLHLQALYLAALPLSPCPPR
jgi:hypothetical protein